MTKHGTRVELGDILAIDVEGNNVMVQYVGKHQDYGDTIWVFDDGVLLSEAIANKSSAGYYAFYPVRRAVGEKLVTVIGSAPMALRGVPRRLRRAGARAADGRILTWVIEDGPQVQVKESLNASERSLPIGAIWSHSIFVQRLAERWKPCNDE